MRLNRSIRHRRRRPKRGMLEIDITSLLDILVIMLVFLLKSYNSSGIVINVPKNVSLPISQSQNQNSSGLIVQVSDSAIWVEDKVIIDKVKEKMVIDKNDDKLIVALFDELVSRKKTINQISKMSPGNQDFSGVINFIIDRSVKYSEIQKLMHTCAASGFQKFKFVVLGEQ